MSQQQHPSEQKEASITHPMDDDRDEDYETEEEEEAFINEEDIDHVAGEYDENDKPPSDDEEEDEWMDDDEEESKNRPLRNVPDYSTSSFNEHTDAIYSISVVENGLNEFLCVTSSGDDSAYLWKFNTQTLTTTPIKRLSGHTDTVLQSKFNFDKSLIATGGMDGTVKIWNAQSGDLISSLEGPAESIEWIDWHPKGNIVIGGSADSTTWMWNTQKELCLNVFSGHSDSVTSGCFSADGKLIVTASEDATVKVWNPKTAECVVTYSAHEKNIKSFCEEPITVLKCNQNNTAIFLCGSLDGSVALCQLEQQRVLSYLRNKHAHTNSVEDVLFHPEQQHLLVSAGMDGQIVLWDTQSSTARQVLKNYPLQEHTELTSTDSNVGGSSTTTVSTDLNFDTSAAPVGVTHIQFDASRPYILYSGDIQGNIFSWDVRVGKVVKMYQGHADVISDFTQSSDYIFSVSEDKRALIFNKQ